MTRSPLLLLALLALPACDATKDTNLGRCSFTATTEGDVREDLGGRAWFARDELSSEITGLYVEMNASTVNGLITRLIIRGSFAGSPAEGTFKFNPASPNASAYWSGEVDGGLSLQSTGGSVRVLHLDEERIEGTFTMDAENEREQPVLTVTGRFNAGTDCPQS